jgi:ankyrin repeat protein
MLDPTMALMYAMDDAVYAASLVRLGNEDGERPDFWLVLPAGIQHMLPQYMDVQSLCRTDSIMTNVLAREAWNIALKGTESPPLSKWPQYSSDDEFQSLRWSTNRRVALQCITLARVDPIVFSGRCLFPDVGVHFDRLCQHSKYVDIAVLLVESNSIDVDMEIALEHTCTNPLIVACAHMRLAVVQALLRKGATVNTTIAGVTPLIAASREGHAEIVQALVQARADVHKAAGNGVTPLIMASENGRLPVVQALLQAGADVDKAQDDGATPLIIASQYNHIPVMLALLRGGADANQTGADGHTLLYAASRDSNLPLIETLLQAGADVDKAADDGATPKKSWPAIIVIYLLCWHCCRVGLMWMKQRCYGICMGGVTRILCAAIRWARGRDATKIA